MALRRMWDAAFPPEEPPAWEVVAGYIGGNTPHVWAAAEWTRQPARWRLPIFTRSHDGDPRADAAFSASWLASHGVPRGVTLALDYETRVDPAYLEAFDRAIVAAGWLVMVYGSLGTVTRNPKPSGGYWPAHWTNVPHLEPGSAATQYGGDVTLGQPYDANLLADTTPLWDTRPEDLTIMDAATKTYIDARFESLEGRLDRAVLFLGGVGNQVYARSPARPSPGMAQTATLADVLAAAQAGRDVTLSPEQLDELKAAFQRLEGSALISLVISPP